MYKSIPTTLKPDFDPRMQQKKLRGKTKGSRVYKTLLSNSNNPLFPAPELRNNKKNSHHEKKFQAIQ
jgi:hypothetical protein